MKNTKPKVSDKTKIKHLRHQVKTLATNNDALLHQITLLKTEKSYLSTRVDALSEEQTKHQQYTSNARKQAHQDQDIVNRCQFMTALYGTTQAEIEKPGFDPPSWNKIYIEMKKLLELKNSLEILKEFFKED